MMRSRTAMWGVLATLGLAIALVAACGGGSSSSTGPSGGAGGGGSAAVVQGQLRSRTASIGESLVVVALERILGIRVAEAAPIANKTVQLVDPLNPANVLYTTTTDDNGNFLFTGVAPGTYHVVVPGFTLTPDPTVVMVDVGDKGIVDGLVDGNLILTTAVVTVNDINDFLQNPVQLCKAVTVANLTNTSLDQIIDDRLSGKGWGRIVLDHGGHPSMLGTAGHCSDTDIATAGALANGKGKGKGNAKGNDKGKKKGHS